MAASGLPGRDHDFVPRRLRGNLCACDKTDNMGYLRSLNSNTVSSRDMGASFITVTETEFEMRESRNPVDNLEVTFRHEHRGTRLPLAVKSNRQLKKTGFESEFVAGEGEQSKTVQAGKPFDPEYDLPGMTVSRILA